MKRIIALLITVSFCCIAWGQAQINTKSVKISDFTQKTTKIVLTGNDFFDASLKDEVAAVWHISPYEFCTVEEFKTLKTDERFYFLLTTKGKFKNEKEAGLQFFTLVKGGKAAEISIDKMLEQYTLASEEVARLQMLTAAQQRKIRTLQQQLSDAERALAQAKLSTAMVSGVDTKAARAQINRLLREVEKCIELVSAKI
jgi:hypothetical protein